MLKGLARRITLTLTVMAALAVCVITCVAVGTSWANGYTAAVGELERATARDPGASGSPTIGRPTPPPPASVQGDATRPDERSATPVAVALVDDSGAVLEENGLFANLDASVREVALKQLLDTHQQSGILPSIAVFYYQTQTPRGTLVALSDASTFLETARRTAAGAGLAALGAFGALFAANLRITRLITRPVQRAWEQQAAFVANASHELKTPLTTIMANVEIVQSNPDLAPEQRQHWIGAIGEETRYLSALVEQLLFLARNDETAATGAVDLPPVDLTTVVRQSVLAFDAVAFEAGVALSDAVAAGVVVAGDEGQLGRLVRILVDNAIKYAGQGGSVEVQLAPARHGHAVLTVRNSGEAIDVEELPHVFDRFWRGDKVRTRQPEGGYGLGLAIARSIARLHGGDIEVTSNPAEGTAFTVRL